MPSPNILPVYVRPPDDHRLWGSSPGWLGLETKKSRGNSQHSSHILAPQEDIPSSPLGVGWGEEERAMGGAGERQASLPLHKE